MKKWQEDYFEDFFDHFGVLSLTANPNDDGMWEAYSDNHQGFCVGFNTIKLFEHLGGGGEVIYYDELPIIYPSPKHSYEQQHILLVFSKLRKWEYEQEYLHINSTHILPILIKEPSNYLQFLSRK